jgi:hypothetical protein
MLLNREKFIENSEAIRYSGCLERLENLYELLTLLVMLTHIRPGTSCCFPCLLQSFGQKNRQPHHVKSPRFSIFTTFRLFTVQ